MPPWRQWYVGRAQIGAFIGWAWRSGRRQLLVPTAANAQPAFAYYRSAAEGAGWLAFAIQVLSLRGREVAAITSFVDPRLFAVFGLSSTLPPNFRPDHEFRRLPGSYWVGGRSHVTNSRHPQPGFHLDPSERREAFE